MKRILKYDLAAALVLALVTIPLCLGVALATGAPLYSGIVSAIIGGVFIGMMSDSNIAVSGPSAGMSAISFMILGFLGQDFHAFLVALALAGVLQIAAGKLKAGFIADFLPANVIRGALSAVGILLILKQLPFTFSQGPGPREVQHDLLEMTASLGYDYFSELWRGYDPGAILLSLTALLVLIYFDKSKRLTFIPGPIIAIAITIILNAIFSITGSTLTQTPLQLVNFPEHYGLLNLPDTLPAPHIAAMLNHKVYLAAIIIAAVATMESLLGLRAIEKLDSKRDHYCSADRELAAQGVGNFLCGLLGGLPLTATMVQTTVNIESGSKSRMSTIFHGIIVLILIFIAPGILDKIPLCALSVILVYTGYKLNKPAIYAHIGRQGLDVIIPFFITLLGILLFDLMIGLSAGLLANLFFILKSSSEVRFDVIQEVWPNGITNRMVLPQQTTFLNKAALAAQLNAILPDSQLVIDARHAEYIDREVMGFLQYFKNEQAPLKNISLNLVGFREQYAIHNYTDFINVTTCDVQSSLTPHHVLTVLKEGNQRFLSDKRIHRSVKSDIQHTAKTQHPIAVVLACIDSRVPVETVFDMSFGDLFCIRVAGNVVNDDILASIEYACAVAGSKLIVVLGHTRCGAIMAANDGVKMGHITGLLQKIAPAITAATNLHHDTSEKRRINDITALNIANTMQKIYSESKIIRDMVDQQTTGIAGAIYDVRTGKVNFRNFTDEITCLNPKATFTQLE